MKKITAVCLFTLVSIGLAAPLLNTKASVNESSFCKKYKCVYVKTTSEAGVKLPNGKSSIVKTFEYTISNGGKIFVTRDETRILTASFIIKGSKGLDFAFHKGDAFAKDFAASFLGLTVKTVLNGSCLTSTMEEDVYTSAKLGSNNLGMLNCTTVVNNPINGEVFTFGLLAAVK